MIAKLPEWYRVLSIANINEEMLEKRSKTIGKALKKKDALFFINCIKLFLNKTANIPEFSSELTTVFLDDPLFPQSNNALELRVLAGALLAEYIETSKADDKDRIALLLKAGQFKLDPSGQINIEIFQINEHFLRNESIAQRTFEDDVELPELGVEITLADASVASIKAELEKINQDLSLASDALNDVLNFAKENISILKEESNIHWWLFREYSNLLKSPYSDISNKIAPFLAGKELSDLTTILPGIINADEFLKKMLFNVKDSKEEVTIKEAVNSLGAEVQNLFKMDDSIVYKELCPLHLACTLALQVGDNDGWTGMFEKATGFKATVKSNVLELALQSYYESLLLKN
ncbi:MAG TPA: GTPase-associated system all-helical protein GASH [Bacteroidia bacterium]|jgi:hypothetical protein